MEMPIGKPRQEPMSDALSRSPLPYVLRAQEYAIFQEAVSIQLERMSEDLIVRFRENPFRGLQRRLILGVSGSRVGSHLLIDNLYQHGVAVDEYFNANRILQGTRRHKFNTLQRYCRFILRNNARLKTFGVKGGPFVLLPLTLAEEFPEYKDEWSFVYLWRADIVRQAVSLAKARISGAWSSLTKPALEVSLDKYDGGDIRKKIGNILETEEEWRQIFRLFAINPLGFSYEDLLSDPVAHADKVAKFADLDGPPVENTDPPYEQQADELNDAWSERFRNENGDFCRRLDERVVLPPF